MRKDSMKIFFASDDNFVMPLSVAIASILYNSNKDDSFEFFVMDDNISEQNKQKIIDLKKKKTFDIEFISVNKDLFKDCPQSEFCPQITIQTYFRYIIPKLKPNFDKVLYLDCDILVRSSLREFWDTELEDKYCAAVQGLNDSYVFKQNASRLGLDVTFNAGVMLINNKKWVEENVCEKLFKNTSILHEQGNLKLQDQDALNYTFQQNVKWVSPRYNYQQTYKDFFSREIYSQKDFSEASKNPCIVYYNGNTKPWKGESSFYFNEYLNMLLEAGYEDEYIKFKKELYPNKIFSVKRNKNYRKIRLLGLKITLPRRIIKKYKNDLIDKLLSYKFISDFVDNKYRYINKHCNSNDFALMKYDYVPQGIGYYNPDCVNIGDYIQSLAAGQYIPENCRLIDRDSLNFYDGPDINMIMNGWYYLYPGNDRFSNSINPLFVAFHINNINDVKKETLDYLKKYEPIGCRDYKTRNFLIKNGIKAYFSSCLTTTLYKKYRKENVERKGIIFTDYEENAVPRKIRKYINGILKEYDKEDIEKIAHIYPLNLSQDERFKLAESLLNKYAEAKLVITSRIHCALPCLALNTPVILVVPTFDEERFYGLSNLLNIVGYNAKGKFMTKVLFDKSKKVVNDDKYLYYSKNLEDIIENWLSK